VAELYDRARPSYPAPVIEAMINALAHRRLPHAFPTAIRIAWPATGDRKSEIAESAGFCDPAVAVLLNTVAYSSSAYADLLQTHSDHILLEDGRRRELLAAIREAIGRHGGWFSLPFKVSVCSATRLRR
jgi:hypothetical protein